MTRMSAVSAFLCGAAFLTAAPSRAGAQQVRCEVHAIRASNEGAEISPQLEPYRVHLLRPPLASFTSFVLIQTQTLTLTQGQASPLRLQNGIAGEFQLDSSEDGRNVLGLSLRHEERTLVNTRFRSTIGHPFFVVVGSVIPRGTLVLGFVCR